MGDYLGGGDEPGMRSRICYSAGVRGRRKLAVFLREARAHFGPVYIWARVHELRFPSLQK